MKAFVFPGQGAQFPGMGKELYEQSEQAKELFTRANTTLGFDIQALMFDGTAEDLKQTNVTQPAVFIHSVIAFQVNGGKADLVAGHSLGEFSALVAAGVLDFKDALTLVSKRANAMQMACEQQESGMAAILGLGNDVVEKICASIEGVVPANYNCPGQLVISGTTKGLEEACKQLIEAGAKRALPLPVSGGFHSPCMQPAAEILTKSILDTTFSEPNCPIIQNVVAKPVTDSNEIKDNLIAQLTGPVKWTQSVEAMVEYGATHFTEFGPGKVLQGLVKKIHRSAEVNGFS